MKSSARTTSTLTLKNVPPHLHRVLKTRALCHKHSLNREDFDVFGVFTFAPLD
ncbi:MAG: hypothetical protein WCP35_07765 [Verrucomicrobiota bacterium]